VLSDVAADAPQAYVEQPRSRREAEREWEDDEDEGREDFASFDEAEENEED
jgi:hypothetical protein